MSLSFSVGDSVLCKVKDDDIVYSVNQNFDKIEKFDIIAVHSDTYILYVPTTICLKSSFIISEKKCHQLKLGAHFIGSYGYYIDDYSVHRVYAKMDGLKCSRCEEFVPMAEPNCEDGTFLCWLCSKYPYR